MKKLISFALSLVLLVAVAFTASAQTKERKGWSPQAKGAVIGTATGAAAGAIIHKRNRAVGGVVGGVVGGAAGYGIGKAIDNKQKREEAERIAAANRAAAASRAANARAAKVTTRKATPAPAAVASNALVANQQNAALAANTNSFAYLADNMFLPNPHFGDKDKPYHTSEYRRKSW